MPDKPESGSLNWLAESQRRHGPMPNVDPLVDWMRHRKIPLTKANYLSLSYPDGVPDPLSAEVEADLPPEVRDQ